MGAEPFKWLGRCSSLVLFAVGGSEVVPPLPPPPPGPLNIMGAIFLFLVAMIFWVMVELIDELLRGDGGNDPKNVLRRAEDIFKIFGLGIKATKDAAELT